MNGIWEMVSPLIPADEREYIWYNLKDMAEAITEYNRSIAGMLKALSHDYSALDEQAVNIQKTLNTPEMAAVLKHFLPEAGLTN